LTVLHVVGFTDLVNSAEFFSSDFDAELPCSNCLGVIVLVKEVYEIFEITRIWLIAHHAPLLRRTSEPSASLGKNGNALF
jgi:hypothetical protein